MNQKNTALLVFSLSAKEEIKRKSIFGKRHKKENVAFFKLLINQTEKLASQSGVDVFWVDEQQQSGPDFSSKFTNAFQKLFDAGYNNVVSIGNDSPDLSSSILEKAINKLEKNKLVLGPSKDGGVYLLGMNKTIFDKNQFQQLQWQTSKVIIGLKSFANSKNFTFDVLTPLKDLDTAEDVHQYSKQNPLSFISRFFKAITSSILEVFDISNDLIPFNLKFSYVGLRAPPSI